MPTRGHMEKSALIGFYVPVKDFGDGVHMGLGLPGLVSLGYTPPGESGLAPTMGMSLAGPYVGATVRRGSSKQPGKSKKAMSNWSRYLEKQGKMFGGAELPRRSFEDIAEPYQRRDQEFLEWAKKKAVEEKTPLAKAVGVGGLSIGALGGLLGAAVGGPKGALAGGTIGALGGGAIGALGRGADAAEIELAKKFLAEKALKKQARVFGEKMPGQIAEAAIPYEHRKAQFEDYARSKAQEPRTPLGKAMGVGGLAGGALGGLIGAGVGGPGRMGRSALIGGGLGLLGGGLLGAGLSEADAAEIAQMKLMGANPGKVDPEIANRIQMIRTREREAARAEARARHAHLIREIRQSKTASVKTARDMPSFLDQNRPAKVKEIYSALKRDHPDMPAEMKARIAARQGKRGKQKQGPPYKGPITSKYKSASLDLALGVLYDVYGPPKVKHAAANYFFYEVNRDERDAEALGATFCKLAQKSGMDPWDMAVGVVRQYGALEKFASQRGTGGNLARFYMRWADEVEKRASAFARLVNAPQALANIAQRGVSAAKAGVGAARQGLMSEKALATRGVLKGETPSVGEAVRRNLAQTKHMQEVGGGSVSRGRGLIQRGEAPPMQFRPPPRAPAQAQAGPEPLTMKDYLGGGLVLTGLGAAGGASLAGGDQTQPQLAYGGAY